MQFKNKYCWRKGTNMPGGAGQDSHRWFGLVFIALWRQASCLPLHSQVVWVTLFSSIAIPAWDWLCHSCPQDKMSTPSLFCCSHRSCCILWPVGSPQPSQPSWATHPAMGFQWDSLRVSFLQGRSVRHSPNVNRSNSFTKQHGVCSSSSSSWGASHEISVKSEGACVPFLCTSQQCYHIWVGVNEWQLRNRWEKYIPDVLLSHSLTHTHS